MMKVDEQPNKKRKKSYHSQKVKATSKMQWLLYHNWVESRKTRKHWILKEEKSPGETRCRKSWDQFEEYGSLTLRYFKQVSGKTKDHRWEK